MALPEDVTPMGHITPEQFAQFLADVESGKIIIQNAAQPQAEQLG